MNHCASWPVDGAVVLVVTGKAVVVEDGEQVMHSERQDVVVPAVVRLARYVRVPFRRTVPLSRRAVMDRDGHTCAYCENRADTIDHVVPRSRGGRHEWHNVVAACARCNHRKGDRLLAEIGWTLAVAPREPSSAVAVALGWTGHDPRWSRYLAVTWIDPGRDLGQAV